jgi:GNAT superfamily N-acetyltransferase
MPLAHLVVETKVSTSVRARQVEALFDVPRQEKCRLEWKGDVPIDERQWNVGLIVGPSGSGKSSIARHLFPEQYAAELEWNAPSVIDDFRGDLGIDAISSALSSVGFNTIPAWLRPYAVLSTGERFRVEVARRVLELPDPVVIDEFTSVVDRQVAQIGSHAIQKFVRRNNRKLVAVGCHFDVIDWLQPDWILEPATMSFQWRSVQRRPTLDIEVAKVTYDAWRLFAPFHYLTADLNQSAQCFCTFVGGRPAAFISVIHFPHPKVRDIKRVPRLVTLPDWQGLGLAPHLSDTMGSAYKAIGYRLRTYPAHPALVMTFRKSPHWRQVKEAGTFQGLRGNSAKCNIGTQRPCATFEYCGPAMDRVDARRLVGV